MREEDKVSKDKRFCYACGSNKTQRNKAGHENWALNKPTDLVLCQGCVYKYIINPKHKLAGKYKKYIRFKNKQMLIGFNPRRGICSRCGYVGQTTMHHIEYHENEPLKDTIELCRKCHPQEDWRLGKFDNRPNNRQPRDKTTGRFISRF
jgi:hypothetical protein